MRMSFPGDKRQNGPLSLRGRIAVSNASSAAAIGVERFHRQSSFLRSGRLGTECTPYLENRVYQLSARHQVILSAEPPVAVPEYKSALVGDLLRRRSQRAFVKSPQLNEQEMFPFLYHTFCAPSTEFGMPAPSAGGIYPIHVLVIPLVPIGDRWAGGTVLHLAFLQRSIYPLLSVDISALENACFDQSLSEEGAAFRDVAFLLAYVFDVDLGTLRYGERGYRFGLLECGAMSQQAALVGQRFGYGNCLFGGYADGELAVLLGFNPRKMLVCSVQLFGATSTSTLNPMDD